MRGVAGGSVQLVQYKSAGAMRMAGQPLEDLAIVYRNSAQLGCPVAYKTVRDWTTPNRLSSDVQNCTLLDNPLKPWLLFIHALRSWVVQ